VRIAYIVLRIFFAIHITSDEPRIYE